LEDMAKVQVSAARNRAARWYGAPQIPVTIRYIDVGNAQGGTILLMHGIPDVGVPLSRDYPSARAQLGL